MVQLYSGDLLPEETWDMLSKQSNSHLIDVRTDAEWHYVGIPDLRTIKKQLIQIQWRLLADMQINQRFIQNLTNLIPDRDSTLIFLCRTAGRSMESAATVKSIGYTKCYNMLHGFEGDLDNKGHRGKINGWKADSLPWRQD